MPNKKYGSFLQDPGLFMDSSNKRDLYLKMFVDEKKPDNDTIHNVQEPEESNDDLERDENTTNYFKTGKDSDFNYSVTMKTNKHV